MLKKHSQVFENILLITDILVIAASWVASYFIRFYSGMIPVTKGVPDLKVYLLLLIPVTIIWLFAFKGFGLYRPKRISSHLAEVFEITKACVVSVLILIAFTFFLKQFELSRVTFLFFTVINIVALSVERWVFRDVLRYLRRKGYNLRCALIVGAEDLAKEIIARLEAHP